MICAAPGTTASRYSTRFFFQIQNIEFACVACASPLRARLIVVPATIFPSGSAASDTVLCAGKQILVRQQFVALRFGIPDQHPPAQSVRTRAFPSSRVDGRPDERSARADG